MSTSTILFLTATACGVLFGGLAVYAQRRDGVPFRALRWTAPALLLAGCVAFGGLAYVLDSGLAETTLYEIDAEGPGAAVPGTITFDIPVEHPGARHDLLVAPTTAADVTSPATVRVLLTDPTGTVVLDEPRTLEPRCDPAPALCDWDSYNAGFTPTTAGPYRLAVTVLTPDVPVLHVRVGDAAKTDGHRAPGY